MIDEPFSALDPLTAENLRTDLLDLWIARRIPTRAMVIVTHSIEEAVFLADRILVLKGSPARVVADVRPELPHWRDRESRAFQQVVEQLYAVVTEQSTRPRVEHHALVARLPTAAVGAMTGMLEQLADNDGRAPLSTLAASLQYDIEDLLGCVDAVELLGFAASAGGDLVLAPSGRAFVDASIQGKQDRFRDALLTRVPNVRDVVRRLDATEDGRLNVDDVLDSLELHFSPEESRRQLEVLIDWGRYAEAFAFDAKTGLLTPLER